MIHPDYSLFVRYKNLATCPDWTNLFMAKFSTHIGCPLMLKQTTDVFSHFNISVDSRQMSGKCSQIHPFGTHFLWKYLLQKTTCHHLNNLFMASLFQLISMSSYAKTNYRCVQSLNISVDVAKCVENVHTMNNSVHSLLYCYKNWLVLDWICESIPHLANTDVQLN